MKIKRRPRTRQHRRLLFWWNNKIYKMVDPLLKWDPSSRWMCLFTTSCGIRTKWLSGRRTPLHYFLFFSFTFPWFLAFDISKVSSMAAQRKSKCNQSPISIVKLDLTLFSVWMPNVMCTKRLKLDSGFHRRFSRSDLWTWTPRRQWSPGSFIFK